MKLASRIFGVLMVGVLAAAFSVTGGAAAAVPRGGLAPVMDSGDASVIPGRYVVVLRASVTALEDKVNRAGRAMRLVTVVSEFRDPAGELVLAMTATFIRLR